MPLGLVQRFADATIRCGSMPISLLAGTLGNHELVTLPGAHPTARIDTGAADYNADANRLLK